MYPTVGRMVHFYGGPQQFPPGDPLAAVIVRVIGLPDAHGHKHPCTEKCATVNLMVLTADAGTRLEVSVPWSANPTNATHWRWPPKVS